MSSVRVNRPSFRPSKKAARPKKVQRPKKEWVSTIHDLSVHKATPQELARRHEARKSQNRIVAQWELREKASQRESQSPGLRKAKVRIIREVFSDQCQMQDVIARSDRVLAAVRDLPDDAPRRRTGFPIITETPNSESPTLLSLSSQSVRDPQDQIEEEDDADLEIEMMRRSSPFSLNSDCLTQVCRSGDQAAVKKSITRQTRADQRHCVFPINHPASSQAGGRSGHTSCINGQGSSNISANQSSLEILQNILEEVGDELDTLDPHSSEDCPQQHRQSFTGFSVLLVSTLRRLAAHVRKREEELRKEAESRRVLEEEVKEQKVLIDALTVESLMLREESAALQEGLQQRMSELEQRLDSLKLCGHKHVETEGAIHVPHKEVQSRFQDSGPYRMERQQQDFVSSSQQCAVLPPTADLFCHSSCHETLMPCTSSCMATGSQGSLDDLDVCYTPLSFASLPRSNPLLKILSPDGTIVGNVEPVPQNEMIQAAIRLQRPSPAGASVSRAQSAERGSACSSVTRATPPPADPQHTLQSVTLERPSKFDLELKLQELNRQSAEARAKVLELIEQQKPSTSRVSPRSRSSHSASRALSPGVCSPPDRNPSQFCAENRW